MALNKGTLVNRVRRMKDEIEGASESESNFAPPDRKEVSVKEEANEDESRRGSKQMRQHSSEALGQHQQQHLHHQQHQHHQHRQHAPTCLASKLVNNNEPSPRAVKQHQPHCIHHNPTCAKQQFVKQASHLNEESPPETAMPDSKGKAVKYLKQQDKSYLLVGYRPSSSEVLNSRAFQQQQRDLRANGGRRQAVYLHEASGSNNKRTTIKFVSQLYFLLHFSVILSLLMHHKNLVISERKSPLGPQASSDVEQRLPFGAHHVKKHTVNESLLQLFANQHNVISMPTTTSSVYNQLPVPLMLQMANNWQARSDGQLISSVVATPNTANRSSGVGLNRRHAGSRLGRRELPRVAGERWPHQQPAADILVRLVGHWHAKCALQYLLCYLLASSVTILVCLRLFRMCTWQRLRARACAYSGRSGLGSASAPTDPASHGFYYRTRLDCTPVLIGSISLGLIQLIVIGLEIATNVDWLGESGWPLYLPLLQFAFVSLLMQYILGKVAKNHKQGSATTGSKSDEKRAVLSIKDGRRFNNNGEVIRSSPGESPISNGLQNIALAHLLVTHILLWLMKLNSISLFQPIDQQHHQQVSTGPILENMFYVNHSDNTQSAAIPPSVSVLYRPAEPDESILANPPAEDAERRNRAEMESILRRKSQLASSASPHLSMSSTTTTIRPSDQTTTQAGPSKSSTGAQQVSVPTEIRSAIANATDRGGAHQTAPPVVRAEAPSEPPAPVSVKSERGLRSASQPHQANQRDAGKSDSTTARPSADRSVEGRQQQAARPEPSLVPPGHQVQPLEPAKNASTPKSASVSKFKSSLPKRMTAFRQNKPANRSVSTGPASTPNINIAGVINTKSAVESTPAPKQRVRVLVSREEGVGGATGPPNGLDGSDDSVDEKGPVKVAERGAKAVGVAKPTERPFPSVESDPPPSGGPANNGERDASPSSPAAASQARPVVKEAGRASALDDTEEATDDDEKVSGPKAGASDEEEEPEEADLDSLLPPVPNYNDTSTDEDSEVELPLKAPLIAPMLARNETSQEKPKGARADKKEPALLQEDAFVFNEAASAANATLAPPPLLIASITVYKQDEENASGPSKVNKTLAPVHEPLVMQSSQQLRQQAQADRARQPSFADYLLPIVHQYHILIIAILFNMWLDSLRKKSVGADIGRESRSGRHVWLARDHLAPASASSSSEVGSVAHSSSTKGLIAIPIRGSSGRARRRAEHGTKPKYLGGSSAAVGGASYAIERVHRNNERWTRNGIDLSRRHHRSRSMDYLHQQALLDGTGEIGSNGSSLSRHNSLRSSSSERLLWIPSSPPKSTNAKSAHVAKLAGRSLQSDGSTLTESSGSPPRRSKLASKLCYRSPLSANWSNGERLSIENAKLNAEVASQPPPNSVCSVFFGLLTVSGSLIVILLGVDLLSTLVQCLTQLISILVCLLGLCLIWRHQMRSERTGQLESAWPPSRRPRLATSSLLAAQPASHRQCFHYLFLLAAYYCGIAIALNLNKQHSLQQLFSQQVLQFAQRHLSHSTRLLFGWSGAGSPGLQSSALHANQLAPANYLFLFHALLAIKGLLLILQVTLQTVLIRSSCQRATKELRQVYTFLMFANLSLWAMEICDQQQHLQRESESSLDPNNIDKFRLLTLDSFGRFAASIVTLSHLYHGLVFMQH